MKYLGQNRHNLVLSDMKKDLIVTILPTQTLEQNFYKTLLDSLFDAVYTVDNDGIITYWNESCARITGYAASEMVGQHYLKTFFPDQERLIEGEEKKPGGIEIVLKTAMPGTWKGFIRRKNGQRVPIESHISVLPDEQGRTIGAVEIFRDNSARLALEDAHRQLLHMSRRDQLTGLYNRSAISEFLKAEIGRSRRYLQPLSVVMVDIDHFKRINDIYGHDAGDKVLAKISCILSHNLRQPDQVGRWGGEEFLIIAPGSDAHNAQHLAERIRTFVREIPLPEVPETITASFGVSQLFDKQSQDNLLYTADMALYQAKRTGRDKVVIGSPQDNEKTAE